MNIKRLLSLPKSATIIMLAVLLIFCAVSATFAVYVNVAPTGLQCNGGRVFFDNSVTGWTDQYVSFVIGHNTYSSVYHMTKIPNTQLYYYNMPAWSGATYLAFMGNSSSWGSGNWGPSNLSNATHRTGTLTDWNINGSSTCNLFKAASSTNDAALSGTYFATYSAMNLNQTVNVKTADYGSSTYTASSAAATVAISSYRVNSSYSSTSTSGTATKGSSNTATAAAVKTATVTLTYANMDSGYTFKGWYNSSSTQVGTGTTYTYTCNGTAATYEARFEKTQSAFNVTCSTTTNGTITASSATAQAGTTITITATPSTNYRCTAVATSPVTTVTKTGDNTYTFTMPSSNVTVTPTFALKPTHTITATESGSAVAGESIQINGSVRSTAVVYEDTDSTVVITPPSGYRVSNVTVTGATASVTNGNKNISFTMGTSNVAVSYTIEQVSPTNIYFKWADHTSYNYLYSWSTGDITVQHGGVWPGKNCSTNTYFEVDWFKDTGAYDLSPYDNVWVIISNNGSTKSDDLNISSGMNQGDIWVYVTGSTTVVTARTDLQTLINSANVTYAPTVANTKYTTASWDNFVTVYNASKTTLSAYASTQTQIDDAETALQNAIEDLEELDKHTITINQSNTSTPGTIGTVTIDGNQQSSLEVYDGSTHTVSFAPPTDYCISSILVNGSDPHNYSSVERNTGKSYTITVTSDMTYTVTYVYKPRVLFNQVNDTGTITPSTGSPAVGAYINYGSTVEYTVSPPANKYIASITMSGGGVYTPQYTTVAAGDATVGALTVTSDVTFTVTYATNPTITFTQSGPAGAISPVSGTSVSYNGSQTFTITPPTGYYISGITKTSGNATVPTYTKRSGALSLTVSGVISNTGITITYTKNPTVSFTQTGGTGTISPASGTAVTYNGSKTFTITPPSGCYITGISKTSGTATIPAYTTAAGAKSLTVSAVQSDTVIDVSYADNPTVSFTTNVAGGTFSPASGTAVTYGGNKTFTLTPPAGYYISAISKTSGEASIPTYTISAGQYSLTVSAVTSDTIIDVDFHINPMISFVQVGGTGTITLQNTGVHTGDDRYLYNSSPEFLIQPPEGMYIKTITKTGAGSMSAYTAHSGAYTLTLNNVISTGTVTVTYEDNPTVTFTEVDGTGSFTAGTTPITAATGTKVDYDGQQEFSVTPEYGKHVKLISVYSGNAVLSTVSYANGPITFTVTNVTSNTVIKVEYAGNPTVTIAESGGSGTVTPSLSQTAVYDGSVTFDIEPPVNKYISAIAVTQGTASITPYTPDSGEYSLTVSEVRTNATVTVTYTDNPTVSYSGTGLATGLNAEFKVNGETITATTRYEYNSRLDIEITPPPGYYVSSVRFNGQTAPSAMVYSALYTITTNTTFEVTYATCPKITVNTSGAGSDRGAITGDGSVAYGGSSRVHIAPPAGYYISEMTFVGAEADTAAPTDIYNRDFTDIQGDITIGVTYTANPMVLISSNAGTTGFEGARADASYNHDPITGSGMVVPFGKNVNLSVFVPAGFTAVVRVNNIVFATYSIDSAGANQIKSETIPVMNANVNLSGSTATMPISVTFAKTLLNTSADTGYWGTGYVYFTSVSGKHTDARYIACFASDQSGSDPVYVALRYTSTIGDNTAWLYKAVIPTGKSYVEFFRTGENNLFTNEMTSKVDGNNGHTTSGGYWNSTAGFVQIGSSLNFTFSDYSGIYMTGSWNNDNVPVS